MRVVDAFGLRVVLAASLGTGFLFGQDLPLNQVLTPSKVAPLDPTVNLGPPMLESGLHKPLAEEYLWTANDVDSDAKVIYSRPKANQRIEPHYFRRRFTVAAMPPEATLYIAGPRSVKAWLNGHLVEQVESDVTSPLGMHVFAADVAKALVSGANTIAIEAVRGRGVSGFANSALVRQQTFGQVMVVKILPMPEGVDGAALMISDKNWKSSATGVDGWEKPTFDDAKWKPVQSIGSIESSVDMFQWNADAGLYDWPGYDGISGYLAHTPISASGILAHYAGRGSFTNIESLTGGTGLFAVRAPAMRLTDEEAPSVVLDFGRELTGRVELISDSDTPATVTVQVGESESETMKAPYLGINQLTIAPHGIGHGPKTAFRTQKFDLSTAGRRCASRQFAWTTFIIR